MTKNKKTKEIEFKLLDETEKSIKIKYGLNTTHLQKKLINLDSSSEGEGNKVQVRLSLWLYRKSFF